MDSFHLTASKCPEIDGVNIATTIITRRIRSLQKNTTSVGLAYAPTGTCLAGAVVVTLEGVVLVFRIAFSGIESLSIMTLTSFVLNPGLANPRLKSTHPDPNRLQELEATQEE